MYVYMYVHIHTCMYDTYMYTNIHRCRYALRELSTAMAEGDRQIARLGVVLKKLAVYV